MINTPASKAILHDKQKRRDTEALFDALGEVCGKCAFFDGRNGRYGWCTNAVHATVRFSDDGVPMSSGPDVRATQYCSLFTERGVLIAEPNPEAEAALDVIAAKYSNA